MRAYLYQPLPMVEPGQRVRVVTIDAGQRATHRLKDLGLVPGVELRVIQSSGNDALIIAVGDSRLAVERGIAHKVLVQPAMREDGAPENEQPSSNHQEVSSCPTI